MNITEILQQNSRSLLLALAFLTPIAAHADSKSHKAHAKASKVTKQTVKFNEWNSVSEFKLGLQKQHQFTLAELDLIFSNVKHLESVRQAVRPAGPGKPKNWKVYRERFLDAKRVAAGLRFWQRNEAALARAEKQFGVPAYILVGLIGVETIYGQIIGHYRSIDALTTLAFDYPDSPKKIERASYFRNELEQLFLLAREQKKSIFDYQGSYAGAIGLPQFMPGSIRNFALDFDADGNIDLYRSELDAIGSVANYLAKHGWQQAGIERAKIELNSELEVDKDPLLSYLNRGLNATLTLGEISAVVKSLPHTLPSNLRYGLIDLQNGSEQTEYWIVSENFFPITLYNRSYFYAMSVIELGQLISKTRQFDIQER